MINFITKYFTQSTTSISEGDDEYVFIPTLPIITDCAPTELDTNSTKCIAKTKSKEPLVYLVIEKISQNPLGIFNTLIKAKDHGRKITHCNCIIIPFRINDPCKYLFTAIYEDV